MEAEVLKRISRGIIMRTGAYLTNDHFMISSGRHAKEYVEKRLVTTEPGFTEGLGEIVAAHFAASPVDVVLSSGIGATTLGHCVARAHPSRPKLLYAVKGKGKEGETEVMLPREFLPFLNPRSSALIIEDILTTGSTVRALIRLVEKRKFSCPFFALVSQEFPTYSRDACPLCEKGVPINTEYGVIVGAPPRRVRGARGKGPRSKARR
jgi:orotate phosphoribosyltransferase